MGTVEQLSFLVRGYYGIRHAWKQSGFRRSILMFSIAALIIFIANFSFVIWAVAGNEVKDGIGVIAEKSCAETSRLNSAIHVIINVLSTILLAGSNYCMQCLSAPTRKEVDAAHKQHHWLDIGVSSVRNVIRPTRTNITRTVIWLLLGLSSLPLHLL